MSAISWKSLWLSLGMLLCLTACPSEESSKKAADEVLRTDQVNQAKELDKTIQKSQTTSPVEESPSPSPENQ